MATAPKHAQQISVDILNEFGITISPDMVNTRLKRLGVNIKTLTPVQLGAVKKLVAGKEIELVFNLLELTADSVHTSEHLETVAKHLATITDLREEVLRLRNTIKTLITITEGK